MRNRDRSSGALVKIIRRKAQNGGVMQECVRIAETKVWAAPSRSPLHSGTGAVAPDGGGGGGARGLLQLIGVEARICDFNWSIRARYTI